MDIAVIFLYIIPAIITFIGCCAFMVVGVKRHGKISLQEVMVAILATGMPILNIICAVVYIGMFWIESENITIYRK